MRRILLLLIVLLIPVVSGLRINEIMYNPDGDDNNREFVEVYMNNPVNLTGYAVADNSSNDTLTLLQWRPTQYALIVEEGFNYPTVDAAVYSAGSTIGNNLDNTGDSVTLFAPNGTMLDTATYSSLLANNNGKSLEFVSGAWLEGLVQGGTPGTANSAIAMPPNSGNATSNATSNATNMTQDGTANVANTTNSSLCVSSFTITTDKQLYTTGEKVNLLFNLTPDDGNFTIAYWVEDLQHAIVKDIRVTANTNAKSFTPDVQVGDQSFLFRANATVCNAILPQQVLFTVVGNGTVQNESSSIQLMDVGTKEEGNAQWGESVNVHILAYRGNTQKSVISVGIVDAQRAHVSQTSKITVETKYTTADSIVPLQLKPNCNGGWKDGNYTIVATGLDTTAQQDVAIEGFIDGLCPAKGKTQQGQASVDGHSGSSDQEPIMNVMDVPESFDPGTPADITLAIRNPSPEDTTISAWSYVYKGSKTYSGQQEDNKQDITIPGGETVTLKLENTVDSAKPGTYKLKVKMLVTGKKTPQEYVADAEVTPAVQSETDTVQGFAAPSSSQVLRQPGIFRNETGENVRLPSTTLVFDSRAAKIRRSIPIVLLILCFIVIVVLVLKDKHTDVRAEPESLRRGEDHGRTFK